MPSVRRTGGDDDNKSPPQAFTLRDLKKLRAKIADLRATQLGSLNEPFTVDDLKLLFVPYEHREALCHVYNIEEENKAHGEIYFDLPRMCVEDIKVFDFNEATSSISTGVMRIYFHRHNAPEGFITPTTIFGTRQRPIGDLLLPPPLLVRHFKDHTVQYLQTAFQWQLVDWVLIKLQNSLRTPQQVRYVWPAIHTLSRMAELDLDLTMPSQRAGMGARPDPMALPYLRSTNDVVSNSVLLGVRPDLINVHNSSQLTVIRGTCQTDGMNVELV